MHYKQQFCNSLSRTIRRKATAVPAFVFMFLLAIVLAQPAQAQFSVIYNFTDGVDGAQPTAGLTMDQVGNLYGTTCGRWCGGTHDEGTVFMLSKKGSGWIYTTLYTFQGGSDGSSPFSRVVFGPDGSLYGTTVYGGIGTCTSGNGCGLVYKLSPPSHIAPSVMNSWAKTVLYRITGGSDGGNPATGDLVFDQQGNIYGTTYSGGSPECGYCGVVFELTPSPSGWTESVLHAFTGDDGSSPYAGVIFDPSGNLYGATSFTVFELTPSGSSWTERVLHRFPPNGSDGAYPWGGLIFDGTLVGTTAGNGIYPSSGGSVFRLDPNFGGFELLYSIPGFPFCGPQASLTAIAGNYYGTTACDGYGGGTVFKLSLHCICSCWWQYDTLVELDGESYSNLVLDADRYAYGTAFYGGTHGMGSVFKLRISAQEPVINGACTSGR